MTDQVRLEGVIDIIDAHMIAEATRLRGEYLELMTLTLASSDVERRLGLRKVAKRYHEISELFETAMRTLGE